MSVYQFIKNKIFLKNILIAAISVSILFWLAFRFLDNYTMHGETISVPDFTGLKMNELNNFIENKKIKYAIIDSIYDLKSESGIVVKQEPEASELVKENRTIYLYITAMLPPQLEMPKLEDRSLRQAIAMLETYGLTLGNIRYVPDQCTNCVLQQLMNGRKIISGTKVNKGSVIDLVVGKGLGDKAVPIPYLIGMTRAEALQRLTESSLNQGAFFFEQPADSSKARIFRQIPPAAKNATVNIGSSIDLFFTNDSDKIPVNPDQND